MNVKLKYDLGVDNTTLTVTHGRKQGMEESLLALK